MTNRRVSTTARAASPVSTGAMAALAYLLIFQRSGTGLVVWIGLVALWLIPAGLIVVVERGRR